MQAQPSGMFVGVPMLFLVIVAMVVMTVLLRRVNGLSWLNAFGLAFLITLGSGSMVGVFVRNGGELDAAHSAHQAWLHSQGIEWDPPAWYLPPLLRVVFTVLTPMMAIPFFLMLAQKWFGSRATEAEKAPGGAGIRAWLTPGRVIWSVFLAVGLSIWTSLSVFVLIALLVLMLMAYPIARWIMGPVPAAPETQTPPDDLAPEREKVLTMIAENRVTPEEGAELLNALASTRSMRAAKPAELSRARKLVLAGAALVVIGFFLPWLKINLDNEMSRLASSMSPSPNSAISNLSQKIGMDPAAMQSMMQSATNGISGNLPKLETGEVQVSGGQLGMGIGWLILIMGIAVAAVPFMSASLDSKTRRVAETVALLIGGFLLLYVTTQNLHFVTFGLVIVLAGYVLELVGSVQEWKTADGGMHAGLHS